MILRAATAQRGKGGGAIDGDEGSFSARVERGKQLWRRCYAEDQHAVWLMEVEVGAETPGRWGNALDRIKDQAQVFCQRHS